MRQHVVGIVSGEVSHARNDSVKSRDWTHQREK
jgi:hypothetical protein